MPKSDPLLWPAEPHTLAKHKILKEYLNRWMPILTKRFAGSHKHVWYIDGFAGPGEYSAGESGSPLVAIQTALGHTHTFPIPVKMTFIEEREDRSAHLKSLINSRRPRFDKSTNLIVDDPIHGDCSTILRRELDKLYKVPPTLAFLDQFGYSDVPMELIARIMANPSCEVFSYLDFNRLNHTLGDPTKETAVTRALGGAEWKDAIHLQGAARENHLLEHP